MEKRRLGRTGLQVSVLGFGGAEIGLQGCAPEVVNRLLPSALDAGLNVIDTAECYAGSEELIGQSVGHRRGDYHLFTKVGHPDGYGTEDWSKEGILASIQRSLKRLATDHLDLVQLHSCTEAQLRSGEPQEALVEARARGYTRFIGYSGDSRSALWALESRLFDTLQTSVSIADQESLDLLLPLAAELDMGVIAKRPIANAAWRTGKKPTEPYHHEYWNRIQKLKYDFLKGDLGASIAVALRFTLSFAQVHTAIVGTQNPDRWTENARLIQAGPLPAEQIDAIRSRWSEVSQASWVGQI